MVLVSVGRSCSAVTRNVPIFLSCSALVDRSVGFGQHTHTYTHIHTYVPTTTPFHPSNQASKQTHPEQEVLGEHAGEVADVRRLLLDRRGLRVLVQRVRLAQLLQLEQGRVPLVGARQRRRLAVPVEAHGRHGPFRARHSASARACFVCVFVLCSGGLGWVRRPSIDRSRHRLHFLLADARPRRRPSTRAVVMAPRTLRHDSRRRGPRAAGHRGPRHNNQTFLSPVRGRPSIGPTRWEPQASMRPSQIKGAWLGLLVGNVCLRRLSLSPAIDR